MENIPKKQNLIKDLTNDPNAGKCRIIEKALRSVGEMMEVAETVPVNKPTPEISGGEKKQLYRLVVPDNQENRPSVNDNPTSKQIATSNQLMQNAGNNTVKFHAKNVESEEKVNFDIFLNGISYFHDDATCKILRRLLDLTFLVRTRRGLFRYNFEMITIDEACNPKIIEKMPGARSFFNSRGELAGHLYKTINALLRHFDGCEKTIYSRPGWKHDLRDYLTADGAIAHPEQPVRSASNIHIHDLFTGVIYTEYCQMLATIKEPGKMQAILSYVLASFLHSVFEDAGFPLKHALFIVGPRGSKKTSVAQCFTQLGEDRRTIRFNFTATESGIQFNLQHYADQVMLIDDLAPSSDYSDRKKREKMLESILRLCGDSGERVINTAFMKTGAEQIDYRVRGGIVITGEYFYGTGSESSIARAVVVKLKDKSVDNSALSYFQTQPEVFESFIFRFLKFVGHNYDSTIALIRNTMQHYRNNTSMYHFSNARYTDYLAQYMAISHILLGMFLAEGNIIVEKDFIDDFHKNICLLLQENDKDMRLQAPVDIVVSAIVNEINQGAIAQWGAPFTKDIHIIRGEDAIFFLQIDLPDLVKKYAEKNNFHNPSLSSIRLAQTLEEHGFCSAVTEGEQKRYGKRYKDYGKLRLMSIPMQKIIEFENYHDI